MSERVDFRTIQRPGSPNTYLVAPQSLCVSATPDAPSPVFLKTEDALFQAASRLVENRKGWSVTLRDDSARHLEAVATTKFLKFKDDVAIETHPAADDPEKSQIAIYSRSRVGYHDLGANRKRVEAILDDLTANA